MNAFILIIYYRVCTIFEFTKNYLCFRAIKILFFSVPITTARFGLARFEFYDIRIRNRKDFNNNIAVGMCAKTQL